MLAEKVAFVKIQIPARYEDEVIPYDFPFRKNDMLEFVVEHPSGRILNFPENYVFNETWKNCPEKLEHYNETGKFYLVMKVVDEGTYTLLDEDKNVLAEIYQNYVPDSYSIPGEYGDYIELDINFRTGVIENWYGNNASFDEFETED